LKVLLLSRRHSQASLSSRPSSKPPSRRAATTRNRGQHLGMRSAEEFKPNLQKGSRRLQICIEIGFSRISLKLNPFFTNRSQSVWSVTLKCIFRFQGCCQGGVVFRSHDLLMPAQDVVVISAGNDCGWNARGWYVEGLIRDLKRAASELKTRLHLLDCLAPSYQFDLPRSLRERR